MNGGPLSGMNLLLCLWFAPCFSLFFTLKILAKSFFYPFLKAEGHGECW